MGVGGGIVVRLKWCGAMRGGMPTLGQGAKLDADVVDNETQVLESGGGGGGGVE